MRRRLAAWLAFKARTPLTLIEDFRQQAKEMRYVWRGADASIDLL